MRVLHRLGTGDGREGWSGPGRHPGKSRLAQLLRPWERVKRLGLPESKRLPFLERRIPRSCRARDGFKPTVWYLSTLMISLYAVPGFRAEPGQPGWYLAAIAVVGARGAVA